MERIKVIGLLGGIGSGKSTVAAMLAKRGAIVLDADRMAHACLAEPDVVAAIIALLGSDVLGADGAIDRARVAARVFSDETARRALNAIIHPRVRERMERELDRALANDAPLVVLDVPLLLESPLDRRCDARLFIEVPEAQRRHRVQSTRGWDPEELARRERAQRSLDEKRRAAEFILDNARPTAAVERDVDELFTRWVGTASRDAGVHPPTQDGIT